MKKSLWWTLGLHRSTVTTTGEDQGEGRTGSPLTWIGHDPRLTIMPLPLRSTLTASLLPMEFWAPAGIENATFVMMGRTGHPQFCLPWLTGTYPGSSEAEVRTPPSVMRIDSSQLAAVATISEASFDRQWGHPSSSSIRVARTSSPSSSNSFSSLAMTVSSTSAGPQRILREQAVRHGYL